MHTKKRDYDKAGVREYVARALWRQQVCWFVRQRGKYKEVPLPRDGRFRARVLVGLWLDAEAMPRNDRAGFLSALRRGMGTPDHAASFAKLQKQASYP